MTKATRERLAKHYYDLGIRDHPYVIEFAEELKVKPDEVAKERKDKEISKAKLKARAEAVAKQKAEAEKLAKAAEKARLRAEKAASQLPQDGEENGSA